MNVGDTVEDKYEVVRLLGQGGMGTVYEARHLKLGRKVALKCLKVELTNNPEAASRFMREARAAASIGSEHIVDVMDVSQTAEGAPYLVMEFLEGEDLSKLISTQGPLDPARAASLTVQLCHALATAHDQGIIHRDIKPENMMVESRFDGTERLKVLDFGLAKFRQASEGQTANLTATGTTMGTPFYMAPEQAMGEKTLDHRVDIYSTGVVLFQMLTKALPFDGETYAEILVKAATKDPVRPRDVRAELSETLESIVMEAIARDPNQRTANAAALAQALMPFANRTVSGLSSVAATAPTQLPVTMPGEVSAMESQATQLPSNMGQVLSDAGQMPSNPGQMPSNPGQMPSNPGQVPSNPGQVPSNPGQMPSNMGPQAPHTFVLGSGSAPSNPSQSVPHAALTTPSPYGQSASQLFAQGATPAQAAAQGGFGTQSGLSQTVPPVAVTPKKSSGVLRFVVLALLVLFVAGLTSAGVWFFLSHGRNGEAVASQSSAPPPPPQTQPEPEPVPAGDLVAAAGTSAAILPTPIADASAVPETEVPPDESSERRSDRDRSSRRERETPEEPESPPESEPEPQHLPFPTAPAQANREPNSTPLPFPSAPTKQPQPQPQAAQVLQPQTQPQPQPQPTPTPAAPAGNAFATGRAQAAARNWNGCIRSLNNAGSSQQVNALRIRCYHGAGNRAQACANAARCPGNRFCQRYLRRHCR